ncbi:aminoacyl-tRNA hydrolase [Helicobacter sp. MIT 99-5507]|uniref:aminoacyl-tRNA hydrolase n=1 Tax=Helicobacter sp. MIT 99-5507 TaxID=152489 RepID=UPI000E1F904C|nr:aminoacyl-tRNA hydrolase [Helicobacter sp. MIT 99-5507]RDU58130.1 aminoacyl-tRNA hydrolase [Helicobacter sp. MIT 99-5507]
MKLIVGLGNPGIRYENTRHNVGFMAIDSYIINSYLQNAKNLQNIKSTKEIKFQSHFFKIDNIIFAKPQTYMNLSGEAIEKIVNYYKIKDILIIHDDLDLSLGAVKIKFGGNSGGHNGLKSIDNHITNKYTRIRIGINHPRDVNGSTNVIDYVLQKFSNDELEILKKVFQISNHAIESFINNESLLDLQNKYNKRV